MSTTVFLAYSNISDEEKDGSSPLYSLLSHKELERKSCFYKLMTSAAHLNMLESQKTNHFISVPESHQSNRSVYIQ